jgi:hypothetical protein
MKPVPNQALSFARHAMSSTAGSSTNRGAPSSRSIFYCLKDGKVRNHLVRGLAGIANSAAEQKVAPFFNWLNKQNDSS